MSIDQISLTREVELLHRQFFRRDAPQGLVKEYMRAHAEFPDIARASESELRTVRIIIEKKLDALGIEPWLRTGPERHLLARKLLLIAYLAECDTEHPEFRLEVKGRVRSLLQLCKSGALAGIILLNGRYQKALYGLL